MTRASIVGDRTEPDRSTGSAALLSNPPSLLTKTRTARAAKARLTRRKTRAAGQEMLPMTAQFNIDDVARQRRGTGATVALTGSGDFDSSAGSSPLGRFGMMTEVIAAATRLGLQQFLNALHDSRRKQAAIELARHRDLIYDPETGIAFGMDRTLHPRS
jgi:hypothetical protein